MLAAGRTWVDWRREEAPMPDCVQWRWLGVMLVLSSLVSPPPILAQSAAGDGWLPGPGAAGPNTYSGVIDAPALNARITAGGTIQLAGWFVDRTADGWAGA